MLKSALFTVGPLLSSPRPLPPRAPPQRIARQKKVEQSYKLRALAARASLGCSFEWFLERVNTRFLSTEATPVQPRAVLIITTKLPFAAITRRRCREKDTEYPVGTEREKETAVASGRRRVEKRQHRRRVERHGLPTTRGPLRGLDFARECRGASPFQRASRKVKT